MAAVRRGALLIDLRPTDYRWREGEVSGAIPVPRHVLEWRLDPHGDYRLAELSGPGDEVVLMCSEGYTSALSADLLQRELGLTNVADLGGGFAAWKDAGLPWISHAPRQLPSRCAGPPVARGRAGFWRGCVAPVRRRAETDPRQICPRGRAASDGGLRGGTVRGTGRAAGERRSLTG